MLLTEQSRGGILHLDDFINTGGDTRKVCDILIDKYPPSQPAHLDSFIEDEPLDLHPWSHVWIPWCLSNQVFHFAGQWSSWPLWLALTARRLCTDLVDPASVASLISCQLIALNKNRGVRPIGIGDTACRIITKVILSITRQDLQAAAGSLQLCASQIAGIEAGVHAVQSHFRWRIQKPFY